MERKSFDRLIQAAIDVGIDADLALESLIRALSEQLIDRVTPKIVEWRAEYESIDGLDQFMSRLQSETHRFWQQDEAHRIQKLIQRRFEANIRQPFDLATKLALIFNRSHSCAVCGKAPPEVGLHIDHVYPWHLGGTNYLKNLQFLCASHNLKKSDKVGYEFGNSKTEN